jgi:hypothetical protein
VLPCSFCCHFDHRQDTGVMWPCWVDKRQYFVITSCGTRVPSGKTHFADARQTWSLFPDKRQVFLWRYYWIQLSPRYISRPRHYDTKAGRCRAFDVRSYTIVDCASTCCSMRDREHYMFHTSIYVLYTTICHLFYPKLNCCKFRLKYHACNTEQLYTLYPLRLPKFVAGLGVGQIRLGF